MTDAMFILIAAVVGLYVGVVLEARRWREKGDHEYMNRCESAGRLYFVKRESPVTENMDNFTDDASPKAGVPTCIAGGPGHELV